MNQNLKTANEILIKCKKNLKIEELKRKINFVAGCDVAYKKNLGWAVIALFSYPELKLKEIKCMIDTIYFPYISGYFSFREGPIILKLLNKIKTKPDLLLVNGQGIAHPLSMGLASYIGIISDIPTIGCTKKSLLKNYKIPTFIKGNFEYIYYNSKKVGVCLCAKNNTKPIFVSPGHLIDIETSVKITLSLCKNSKYPLPLRLSHSITHSQAKGKLF
jgi:deoxyribonuclease V